MIEFILYVRDQSASKEFYREVLSSEPILDVPGMTEFSLSENCTLGLMPEDGIAKIIAPRLPHPKTGRGIPRSELYLQVENPELLMIKAIHAGALEVSMVSKRDWGDKVGYVADPDGHIIAFASIP
jgi:uncharacterized glyoxalase superfamily protein PhnB